MDPNDTTNPHADAAAPTNADAAPGAAGGDAQQQGDQQPAEPSDLDVVTQALAAEEAAQAGQQAGAEEQGKGGKDGAAADADASSGKEEGKDGQGADAAKDPKPDDGKPKPDEKPKPDPEAEAEANALGLEGKSRERFHAMSAQIKTAAPIMDALTKAGITDVSQVPAMLERSQKADDVIAMVMETGADAEQYGLSLDYLTVVNKAKQGDLQAAERAFTMVQSEYTEMAKALGKDVPGINDPLAAHPDLLAEVEGGMARARALEIAESRRVKALQDQVRTETQQTTQHREAHVRAVESARGGLNALGKELVAGDPQYAAKEPALKEMIAFIAETLPPEKWVEAARAAYARIPAPPAVAGAGAGAGAENVGGKPRVSTLRPGATAGTNLQPVEFASDLDAVNAALESMPA